MMRSQRIIGVHLLNDFSGSPFVFSQALEVLQSTGHEVHLFTATPSGNGFLTGIPNVNVHPLFYRWSPVKLITLLLFCFSQLSLLLKLIFFLRNGDIVYINSMLPFGAAIAGKFKSCKIIYHIHEVSIQPQALKKFFLWMIQKTAHSCLYVSHFLQKHTPVSKPSSVIYNSLPAAFINTAEENVRTEGLPFTVLMLCSLKKYKGVFEFVACAMQCPAIRFQLVLNATQDEINNFFSGFIIPPNAQLFPAQKNVHAFYRQASMVLNLSLVNEWVETFGMTILEAMYYKLPVIIPPVGGITELVDDGINGFMVDAHNGKQLRDKIHFLSTDQATYNSMSAAAFQTAKRFGPAVFREGIVAQFDSAACRQASSGKKVYSHIE